MQISFGGLGYKRVRFGALCSAVLIAFASYARGQGLPNPGQSNQDILRAPPTVMQSPKPSPLPSGMPMGGDLRLDMNANERVAVRGISFAGNAVIPSAELAHIIPALKPDGETVADLNAIADAVTAYYRSKGYPFAHAMFQPQRSNNGMLELSVFEGQFGKINVHNTSGLRGSLAKDVLTDNLCDDAAPNCHNARITEEGLQRSYLLLSDMPGITVTSAFAKGQENGTADLNTQITSAGAFTITAGADNFGSPSTGEGRGSLGLTIPEILGIGDRLDLSGQGSGENMWSVVGGYSVAVGPSGLRAGITGARTTYLLGGDFAALGANGVSDIASAYVSYPAIRSANFDLNLGMDYAHKKLSDNIDSVASKTRSHLDDIDLTISGDANDDVLGGGTNTYNIGFTHGMLGYDDANSLALDQNPTSGPHAKGSFNKLSFNVERQQKLFGGLTFFLASHGQYADRNLTSAEKMFVGGPDGVRAYSVGEGGGDTAIVGTAELRYSIPFDLITNSYFTFGAFYDGAWVRTNAHALTGELSNSTDYGGGGLRIALQWPDHFAISAAWASQLGGRPSTVQPDKSDHFWLQTAFQF